jgi:hypothetical protein
MMITLGADVSEGSVGAGVGEGIGLIYGSCLCVKTEGSELKGEIGEDASPAKSLAE